MPIAIVTGATGGIGRWIARGLAQAGQDLILIARDPARGNAAADWIKAEAPATRIQTIQADLSLLADTRRAGEAILQDHPAIDVLVNNAGIFRARREVTAEGLESVITVNHSVAVPPHLDPEASAATRSERRPHRQCRLLHRGPRHDRSR